MDDPVHFWLDFWHVLTLRSSYNATLVILGTTSLGIASGIVGTFAEDAQEKLSRIAKKEMTWGEPKHCPA